MTVAKNNLDALKDAEETSWRRTLQTSNHVNNI